MPYKGVDKDQEELKDFARRPVSVVTALKPPAPEVTIVGEIVETLETLLEEIRSGAMDPCYLIIGWGEEITNNKGQKAYAYNWDAMGLETSEVIGHCTTYATKLAMGEGE